MVGAKPLAPALRFADEVSVAADVSRPSRIRRRPSRPRPRKAAHRPSRHERDGGCGLGRTMPSLPRRLPTEKSPANLNSESPANRNGLSVIRRLGYAVAPGGPADTRRRPASNAWSGPPARRACASAVEGGVLRGRPGPGPAVSRCWRRLPRG